MGWRQSAREAIPDCGHGDGACDCVKGRGEAAGRAAVTWPAAGCTCSVRVLSGCPAAPCRSGGSPSACWGPAVPRCMLGHSSCALSGREVAGVMLSCRAGSAAAAAGACGSVPCSGCRSACAGLRSRLSLERAATSAEALPATDSLAGRTGPSDVSLSSDGSAAAGCAAAFSDGVAAAAELAAGGTASASAMSTAGAAGVGCAAVLDASALAAGAVTAGCAAAVCVDRAEVGCSAAYCVETTAAAGTAAASCAAAGCPGFADDAGLSAAGAAWVLTVELSPSPSVASPGPGTRTAMAQALAGAGAAALLLSGCGSASAGAATAGEACWALGM